MPNIPSLAPGLLKTPIQEQDGIARPWVLFFQQIVTYLTAIPAPKTWNEDGLHADRIKAAPPEFAQLWIESDTSKIFVSRNVSGKWQWVQIV